MNGFEKFSTPDGQIYFKKDGEIFREEELPGITKEVSADGTVRWHKDGWQHREGGPAVINSNGTKEWWFEGKRHREGGPATEYADGSQFWYHRGQRHRTDGPAIVNKTYTEWWIAGHKHREDGPAVIHADGSEEWWDKGEQHRAGGPAITNADGSKEWWVTGGRHHEDGPAVINADGSQEWWIRGKELTEGQFNALKLRLAQEKAEEMRASAAAVLAPFRGTVNAVAAPEKAAFKRPATKRRPGMPA